MLEWISIHRGFYAFLVLLFLAVFWLATEMKPLRCLIGAWRMARILPRELAHRGAQAVAFGVSYAFLAVQVALACLHIWLPQRLEYAVWFVGILLLPLLVQRGVERMIRRHVGSATAGLKNRGYLTDPHKL